MIIQIALEKPLEQTIRSELMPFNYRPASATRKSHPAGENDWGMYQETQSPKVTLPPGPQRLS